MAKHSSSSRGADGSVGKSNGESAKSANRRKVAAQKVVKPAKPADGNGDNAPAVPMPKTHLSDAELGMFRELLLQIRRQILGDVDNMQNEASGRNRSEAAGDLSLMPIHMADIGTDNYEREFTMGLIQNETETLKEIDAALKRIDNKTYGVCEATHKPITKSRLKARPWARYTIAHKRSMEENGR